MAAANDKMRPEDSIRLPSGNQAWLHDVIKDDDPRLPRTWRYRFVVPALADRFPPLEEGGMHDLITQEDTDELDGLGLVLEAIPDEGEAELDDTGLVTIGQLEAEGAISGGTIIDYDSLADETMPSVPADPSVLMQDKDHADLVHLCETVVLPEIRALDQPLAPASIIISLADRAIPFGEINHDAVQLFEGFHPSRDRRACIWDPW